MNQLPNWPLYIALSYAGIALIVMWIWSKRLDRADEEARRRQQPAE